MNKKGKEKNNKMSPEKKIQKLESRIKELESKEKKGFKLKKLTPLFKKHRLILIPLLFLLLTLFSWEAYAIHSYRTDIKNATASQSKRNYEKAGETLENLEKLSNRSIVIFLTRKDNIKDMIYWNDRYVQAYQPQEEADQDFDFDIKQKDEKGEEEENTSDKKKPHKTQDALESTQIETFTEKKESTKPSINTPAENKQIDDTPPALKDISFQPSHVKRGEKGTVTVEIEEKDITTNSVYILFRAPTRSFSIEPNLSNKGGGRWVADFTVPYHFPPGTWRTERLRITDSLNKTHNYENHQISQSFNVISPYGTGTDLTPPELKNVTFQPTRVETGGSIKIIVEATDNLSGLKSVSVHLKSPTEKHVIGANIWDVESRDKWSGQLSIPVNAEKGTWRINYIGLSDYAGNSKYYKDIQETFEVY